MKDINQENRWTTISYNEWIAKAWYLMKKNISTGEYKHMTPLGTKLDKIDKLKQHIFTGL